MMAHEKAVRYSLGEDARAHLREKLEIWGHHVVTAAVKEQLDLSEGEIFAFLPENLSADELTIEALSRICYERDYDMYPPIFRLLQEHLNREDAVVIVPEVMPTYQEILGYADAGADWLPPLLLGFDTQACHAWTFYTEDESEFEAMLGMTEDWQHLAFLTYLPKLHGRTGKFEIETPEPLLKGLAAETRAIIFKTFDGEGCIVWEK